MLPKRGFLEIYQNDKLVEKDSNIILDSYRIAMSLFARSTNAIAESTELNTVYGNLEQFEGGDNRYVDLITPHGIALDNGGALFEGAPPTVENFSQEGQWEIFTPGVNDYVEPEDCTIVNNIQSRNRNYGDNVTTLIISLGAIEEGKVFTRATLLSQYGLPLATKCFKGKSPNGGNLRFDWSVVY